MSYDSTENRQVKLSREEIWTAKPQESVLSAEGKLTAVRSLRSVWSEWLDEWNWDWWVSLTFRDKVSAKSANKKWNKWIKALEFQLNDRVGFFRCTELQRGRKVLHFHSFILNVARLHTRTMGNWLKAEKILKKIKEDPSEEEIEELAICIYWGDKWNEISGFGRIYRYDPTKKASYYLTKYISKELSDYRLGGCILRT